MSKVQLFALPFAGGNVYSYQLFKAHAQQEFEFIPLELPGRGRRMIEPLVETMESLVDDYFKQISGRLDKPFALFGHSLGAAGAVMLARKLSEEGLPMPQQIFVSGRSSLGNEHRKEQYHDLPSVDFWNKVAELGGMPKEILEEESLKMFLEPILKADFKISETFEEPDEFKISVPIKVYIGTEDVGCDDEILWGNYTDLDVEVNEYPGHHFFIFSHIEAMSNSFSNTLKQIAQRSF
jgi:surfactin synthase thioesterase subunit